MSSWRTACSSWWPLELASESSEAVWCWGVFLRHGCMTVCFWRLLKRYTFQKCLLSGFGFGKNTERGTRTSGPFMFISLGHMSKILEKSISSLLQRFRKLQHGIPRMDLACFHGCFRFLHPSKTPTKESAEFSDSHIWPQVAICHWDYSISNIFILFLNTFFHLRLLYNYTTVVTFFRKFPPLFKKKQRLLYLTYHREKQHTQPPPNGFNSFNGFETAKWLPPGVLHADGHPSPAGSDEHSAPGCGWDRDRSTANGKRFLQVDGRADGWNPMVFPMFDLYMYIIPILIKMV